MAFAAGAAVIDLEFVQFHPTALMVEGQPRFLLSEALRGEGARLVNADGEAVHDALRSRRRSGAARSRVARHRSRKPPDETAGVSVAGAARSRFRPRAVPADFRCVPARRSGSGPRSHSGRTSGALRHGWSQDRSRWPHHHPGTVCRRRGCLHRRPRRQPSGEQFASGGARLRGAGGMRDASGHAPPARMPSRDPVRRRPRQRRRA